MSVARSSPPGPGPLLSAGRSHLGLLVLLAVYLSVALIYGQLKPLGEAPDEIAHMDLIRFIGEEGHLPRSDAERQAAGYKSDSPMLYHVLVGAATGWIDYDELPRLKVNDASPRHILINDGLSPFAVIHTDDEALPYRGIVLAWHLARLASTVFSLLTLVVIYAIALTIRPGDHWLALGATAVAAAIPQFHLIASSVNDDNLLGLLSALFILVLLQAWKHPRRRSTYVWLGLWFGLALTTKYTILALLPLVLVVLARAVRRRELGWTAGAGRLLIFGTTAFAVAAWWFIYVEWYFNEIGQRGLIAGLTKPLSFDVSTEQLTSLLSSGANRPPTAFSPGGTTLWDWASNLFRSFWFVPGQASAAATTILSTVFLGLCLLAVLGLWRGWRRGYDWPWPILGLLGLLLGLLVPVPLLRFYLTLNPAEAGQGRHILFPAAAAVGLLLTLGLTTWLPTAYRRFAGLGLAGILLVVSLISFFGLILPAFPSRLPVRTTSDALKVAANPINASFNEAMELVGYDVGEINQHGALPICLVWRSLDYAEHDQLVELSLLDEEGQVRGFWVGHPVDGRYPTRAWEPGDVVRDTIWLPLINLEAGSYRLQLHLTSPDATALHSGEGSELFLTDVSLPATPARAPLHSLLSDEEGLAGFDVWQTGERVEPMPVYSYRATIPVTIANDRISHGDYQVFLVGPDGSQHHPIAQASGSFLFLVDAFWPSGEYTLQVDRDGARIESKPALRVQVRPRNFDVPPMSNVVRANFGNEIMLLGFDFPENRTEPGGTLPISLYWKALRPTNQHYIVANHLLNSTDLHQWGGRDRVPQTYYSTALWTPSEVVRDDYLVPVDPAAPPGVYHLDIGLYVELTGQSWHLPLVQDGTELDARSVTIGPIKVGGPPPGVTTPDPSPQQPRADNLEGLVTLLGYDLDMKPGAIHLTLYWRSEAPIPTDYTTFVHVRDSTGQATGQPGTIVAQMDHPPADGMYPTSLWDPGEVIRDSVQIPVPAEVPPGQYEVVVGLYDFDTGRRLYVFDDQGTPVSDHIQLEKDIRLR